ncbi:MAG: 30S ribosomal protein S20 [Bacillota bacterium]|jgi:small subunit ribosomal protein S20
MANIKSAKKRVLIAESRRQRNAAVKSQIKTQLKKYNDAVASGDKETAKLQLHESIKVLDKSASKGVIHKNCVARRKSNLYKIYNQI